MKISSKKLQKLDKKLIWHPFTQMKEWRKLTNIIIESGKGNYLVDTDGKKYLDCISSLWVTVHGHRRAEIDKAIKAQVGKISHSTLLGLGNVPSIELASELVRITPKALKKVFYSDNGSTAVEVALKMSYQYWAQSGEKQKKHFIAFTGSYHGDTFGSMSVGEIDVFVKKYRPLLFKSYRAPYPYCYRCPVGKKYPSCKVACLDEFEKTLKKHKNTIAACIIEPLVEGASGMITAPDGFFKEVRRLTKKYNVHLIADEVATGFGRTGKMFACDVEKVTPDFLCLAKGLTGGYLPLAATLTTDKIYKAFLGDYDEFKSFFHGHTYTGNPLGAAASVANLKIFKKEGTIKKLAPLVKALKKELAKFKDLPHVGEVRQRGLMVGIELVKNKASKKAFPTKRRFAALICKGAIKRGMMIRPIGDTIIMMPPLSILTSEIKKMTRVVYEEIVKESNE